MSTTINKYCYVTCRYLPPYFKEKHRIVYSKIEVVNRLDEISHPIIRESLKYSGVKKGLEIQHHGDVPGWSGMGTSSSFAVGLLNALYSMNGTNFDKYKLAHDAITVEREKVKRTVGSQDHIAASFGGMNRIDFLKDGTVKVRPISIPPERLRDFKSNLMLFFTNITRESSDIEKDKINNMSKIKPQLSRLHQMVDEGIQTLKHGDLNNFGELMDEAWSLKKSLSAKVTRSEIDTLYSGAKRAGAIGGKLLGAGGGGFFLLFVPPEHRKNVKKKLSELKFNETPFEFETGGSRIIFNDALLI